VSITEDTTIHIDQNSAECVHLDPLGLQTVAAVLRITHNQDSLAERYQTVFLGLDPFRRPNGLGIMNL
jgi:hypothetical protein